jgi:hypothetical protein
VLLQIVTRQHLMPLATFLPQANPSALTPRIVAFDPHGDDGADAGKGKRHHRY